jgi:hypothetical protein
MHWSLAAASAASRTTPFPLDMVDSQRGSATEPSLAMPP